MTRIRERKSPNPSRGRFRVQTIWSDPTKPDTLTTSWSSLSSDSSGSYSSVHSCSDEVAVGDNHPFSVSHLEGSATPLNGVFLFDSGSWGGRPWYDWIEFQEAYLLLGGSTYNGGFMSNLLQPSWPSDSALVTRGLALANPNRPDFSVLNFALELRELPELVRSAGRGYLQRAASTTLTLNFGINPFLGDFAKLLDFQGAVERRLAFLRNAKRRGIIKRTRQVYSDTQSRFETQIGFQGSTSRVNGRYDRATSIDLKAKVHGRWRVTSDFPSTDLALRQAAIAGALGFPTSGAAAAAVAWEALPWSWLIDWFFTVGSAIEASDNSCGLVLDQSTVRVMKQATTSIRAENFKASTGNKGWASGISGSGKIQTKTRYVPSSTVPSITTRDVFLSGTQLGILASLAVLKSGRYPDKVPTLRGALRALARPHKS